MHFFIYLNRSYDDISFFILFSASRLVGAIQKQEQKYIVNDHIIVLFLYVFRFNHG